MSLLDAFRHADQVPELTTRAANAAKKLAGLFDGWRNLVADGWVWLSGQTAVALLRIPHPRYADAENVDDPLFDTALAEKVRRKKSRQPSSNRRRPGHRFCCRAEFAGSWSARVRVVGH